MKISQLRFCVAILGLLTSINVTVLALRTFLDDGKSKADTLQLAVSEKISTIDRPPSSETTVTYYGTTPAIASSINDLRKIHYYIGSILTPPIEKQCAVIGLDSGSTLPGAPHVTSPSKFHFDANRYFKRKWSYSSDVSISWLGSNFRNRFLEKVEENEGYSELKIYRLKVEATSLEIIQALNSGRLTSLTDLGCLLRLQPHGESGTLLVNGARNIFFLKDAQNKLWTVDVLWGGAGWEIGASLPTSGFLWQRDSQIIGRSAEQAL